MSNRPMSHDNLLDARAKLAAQNLKSCPLCGAINAADNPSCFACSWAGQFDQNPHVVQLGLECLIGRCPELAEEMRSYCSRVERPQDRILGFLRRMFRRTIDVRI